MRRTQSHIARSMPRFIFALTLAAVAGAARAELRLPAIFSDGMVLQRDRAVKLWGRADQGAVITVTFAGQTIDARALPDGTWAASLQPVGANSQGQDLTIAGAGATLTIHDVVVGDVWHAGGQSNMAMTGGNVPLLKPLIAEANFPLIRNFRIHGGSAPKPLDELRAPARWEKCTPQSAGGFSAAALFFARRIHQEIGVPIGIIDTSRGGQPIETFIPRQAFKDHPTLIQERELGDKEDLSGIWHLSGGVRARNADWFPGRDYNALIAPIARYTLRGFIWYQGESNCGQGEDPRDYRQKMGALVAGWREAFAQGNLPLYYVQLPGSGAAAGWPYLREQQRLSLDLPNVAMAVTIDLEAPGIHPPNKFDVGQRLAACALAGEYGKKVEFSGPMFASADVHGSSVTVHFTHADGGLMIGAKSGLDSPVEAKDRPIALFEVADAAGHWQPAQAKLVGEAVEVQSERVASPVAIRYAYQITPTGPFLYNRAGLPAAPFCSKPELLSYDPQISLYEEKKRP